MNIKKSQFGGVHLLTIIIIVIFLLGFLGFLFWNNFIKEKNSAVKKITPTVIKKQDSLATKSDDLKIFANQITGVGVLKYPATWVVSNIFTNNSGVLFESSDFKSESGLYNIINGSSLSISVSACDFNDIDENLISDAMAMANTNSLADYSLNDINGERVVKFSYDTGENRNNQVAMLFYRGGLKYEIVQQYGLESDNLYPDLLNTIVSNIKFNN